MVCKVDRKTALILGAACAVLVVVAGVVFACSPHAAQDPSDGKRPHSGSSSKEPVTLVEGSADDVQGEDFSASAEDGGASSSQNASSGASSSKGGQSSGASAGGTGSQQSGSTHGTPQKPGDSSQNNAQGDKPDAPQGGDDGEGNGDGEDGQKPQEPKPDEPLTEWGPVM